MQDISKSCPINDKPQFLHKVFANLEEILECNITLSNNFKKRQSEGPVVKEVADIIIQNVGFVQKF